MLLFTQLVKFFIATVFMHF